MDIIHQLLVLLAASFQIRAHPFLSCDDFSKACECIPTKSLELHCPSKTSTEAVIQYSEFSKIKIICSNPYFDVGSLDLKIENATIIKVHGCRPINGLLFGQLTRASRLATLTISNSYLNETHVEALQKSVRSLNIVVLTLDRNELRTFPEVFDYLEDFDLSNNAIKELPDRLRFPSLIRLILKNNSVEYLSNSLFEAAPKLKYIDLSGNKISRLPPQLLHPLVNLTVLSLSSNKFRSIPNGFFEKNFALRDVWLSNGNLREIGANMFSNCSRLSRLKLGNNSLDGVPLGMFSNMRNLEYLELSLNQFSDFPRDTFKGLSKLEKLFLFGNNLTNWYRDYNRDLKTLRQLSLNNNSLYRIEEDAFEGLHKLRILDLSHNGIFEIEGSAFASLKELLKINLSFNKLILADSIIDMPFGDPRKKKEIDLSFNNISRIKFHSESIRHPERGRQVSSRVYPSQSVCLFGNPILCDCESTELLRYLKGQRDSSKPIQMPCDLQCATPDRLKGSSLKDIDLDEFTCDDTRFYNCPENCTCEISPFTETFRVDCSNGELLRPPVVPALKGTLLEFGIKVDRIEVNLVNNSISEFTRKDISYHGVNVLNLSNNKLAKIEWIPSNLEVLRLDSNQMSKLEKNVIQLLNESKTLMHLQLDNNPWVCDCEMSYLADTLRRHMFNKISNNTITCADGSSLMDLSEDSICGFSVTLISLILVLCTIGLLTIAFFVLFIYFQDYVKMWLYNHSLMLFLISEKDLDRDKIYDAFVSYSHKDVDFIVEHLVPELENGPDKYKLCLHERDWIVGEYIPKQISDSVQNSRRTIIVLSRNFLEGDWTTMEFITAHSHSIREGRNRLIIILYEDIDIGEVNNEELKLYLKTNTYIKWGDPWFWEKLRRSLSRRKIEKIYGRNGTHQSRISDVESCANTKQYYNSD